MTHSFTSHLAVLTISSFVVDRFGRSLRFCYFEFEKYAISYGCKGKVILESRASVDLVYSSELNEQWKNFDQL